jgi:phosphatidate cytidylyltransferase
MLRLRIVTAAVLLAVMLSVLFAPWPQAFTAFTLVAVAVAAWEWARLNGLQGALALGFALLVLGSGVITWASHWIAMGDGRLWWAVCALWSVGASCALYAGAGAWSACHRVVRLALGGLMLWAAWLAMARARVMGLNFLLSVFTLVWVADIAAYAGGRTWGRRKLAPRISPGKSWEGAISGWAGVSVLAVGWIAAEQAWSLGPASVFSVLLQRLGMGGLVLALMGLAAMSVVGDLIESLVKRAAGVKDSSALLPGHGGVLDRIDALLPVFPLALALASW